MGAGLVAINVAAVIFGSAALFGKLDVSPYWIVASRAVFAAATLALVGLIRGGLTPVPGGDQRSGIVVTGLVLAVHWLSFFAAVQLAGVAIATLTFATFPLFTVLLETVAIGRRPTLLELGAASAITVAVALLVDVRAPGGALVGAVFGLASALTFAYFGVAAKGLSRSLTPLSVSFWQNVVVASVLAIVLPFIEGAPSTAEEWGWLLVLGVVTTALMHQLYLFALTRLSATTCSGFVALEPVYAVGFAAVFFGEPLTVWVFISGTLIIGSSIVLLKAATTPGGRALS